MSTQQKTGLPEAISEQAIAQYLQMHPDFFDRHPSLLTTLRLSHGSGPAVSLIERQVAVLRTRNAKLERQLHEFDTVASLNHTLSEKSHRLAGRFLDAQSPDDVVAALRASLAEDFQAEFAVLLVFSDTDAGKALAGNSWVRQTDRHAAGAEAFATLLVDASPRCGRLTEAQRDFIFGAEDGSQVASAALTPLGKPAVGMLGIGSSDPDRFLPTMSMDFLSRVGELIAHAVRSRVR
jgi:uncharacterized protein YigA (DUF484 family)